MASLHISILVKVEIFLHPCAEVLKMFALGQMS